MIYSDNKWAQNMEHKSKTHPNEDWVKSEIWFGFEEVLILHNIFFVRVSCTVQWGFVRAARIASTNTTNR